MQNNLEFNVELKNRSDYDFVLQKFTELWAKSVDVTKDYVTTIEVKSSPRSSAMPRRTRARWSGR